MAEGKHSKGGGPAGNFSEERWGSRNTRCGCVAVEGLQLIERACAAWPMSEVAMHRLAMASRTPTTGQRTRDVPSVAATTHAGLRLAASPAATTWRFS